MSKPLKSNKIFALDKSGGMCKAVGADRKIGQWEKPIPLPQGVHHATYAWFFYGLGVRATSVGRFLEAVLVSLIAWPARKPTVEPGLTQTQGGSI